jgi:hypothetical protein
VVHNRFVKYTGGAEATVSGGDPEYGDTLKVTVQVSGVQLTSLFTKQD